MAKIFVYGDGYGRAGTGQADTFHVSGANNTLVGGGGNDTYNIYNQYGNAYGNSIVEGSGGGIDTVNYHGYIFGFDRFFLDDNVENLNLRGYGDTGYGNALGNVMRADSGDMWNDAVMFGGDGNDTIIGSNEGFDSRSGDGDSLYGDEGNDSINGGAGSDWIYGGAGADSLSGGNVSGTSDGDNAGYGGGDTIFGHAGNDTISGGDVTFVGRTGYGYTSAYAGDDNLEGGEGDDLILGGNDHLRLGQYGYLYGGNDRLYGDEGNDTILGGNNVLYGSTPGIDFGGYNTANGSFDTLYGSGGNDVLRGGSTTINGGGVYLVAYGGYGSFYGMDGNDSMVAGNTLIRMGNGGGYGYGNSSSNAGSWAGDEMFGGTGNDTLNSGSTTVLGGLGRDFIAGSGDVLYGDIYNDDYAEGEGPGNDSMADGSDLLEGGAGDDTLYGGYNMFYGDGGNDTIVGGSETLRGGAGDDTLYGGVDKFYGGAGNDLITAGNESIDGGTGQNFIENGYAVMYGDAGNDTLIGGNTDDRIYGENGNDSMLGNAGNDVIDAADQGADFADGGAGDDTVYGSDHGDTIQGGLGDDILSINFYYGGSITVLDAGGDDRLIVHGERAGTFVLPTGIEGLSNHGNFRTLVGNALDNYIEGNGSSETLLGLVGNDALDGGGGGDRLVGGIGNDAYTVDSADDVVVENAAEGIDTVFARGAFGVLADNVENLYLGVDAGNGAIRGNALANLLVGNMYGNVIEGGALNDTIDGGGGIDRLIGGTGDDSYTVRDFRATIVEQAGGGTDTVRIFDANSYQLSPNVDHAILGDAWDNVAYGVTGNASNNRLEGNKWDNNLVGGGGNDTLIGGGGDDWYEVDSTADVVTEALGGGDDWMTVRTTATSGSFVMAANVEDAELLGAAGLGLAGNLLDNEMLGNAGGNSMDGKEGNDEMWGMGGNDTLIGGIGNDLLDGERGNDSMAGGAGNDTYYVDRGDGAGSAITTGEDIVSETIALGGGTDQVFSSVYTYSLGANVENLTLTGQARKGFGNELPNVITGNSANNLLSGGGGNDSLAGNIGNDSLAGGGGDDRLDGGAAIDSMTGGAGNDTYIVDNAGDAIVEAAGLAEGAADLVLSSTTYSLSENVENLTLTGTGGINGTGNTGANLITGNSGWNILDGGAGNDTLIGNDGTDVLIGGAGNDSLAGGTEGDTYYVDSTLDVVNEGVNWGLDQMIVQTTIAGSYLLAANVETLTFDNGEAWSLINHNGTGNVLDNVINGNAGNNSLSGLGGEDTINAGTGDDSVFGGVANDSLVGAIGNDTLFGDAGDDYLDGGAGNDFMQGGDGDDFYVVDASGDTVAESPLLGAGALDEVQVVRSGAFTAYTLAANVENLSTSNAFGGGMTLTGNALNNAFEVGPLNLDDNIDGGAGTDSIHGAINFLGTASLSNFESAAFDVYLDSFAYLWTVNTGGLAAVTLRGGLLNDANLVMNGLGANAAVTMDGFQNNSAGSLLTLALGDVSGGSDKITFNVVDTAVQNLGIAGVETLAFNLAASYTHFNLAGVSGETLLTVTGGIAGDGTFILSGINDTQLFRFQNFSSEHVTLALGDDSGIDSFELDLDNAAVDDLDLSSGLETLTLDTRGDPGFANGSSLLQIGDSGATTALTIVGGQDLTVWGFDGVSVDAEAFSGDLDIRMYGATSFTAGSGNDTVWTFNTNATLNFGTQLDANDWVYDQSQADTDVLNAEFADGDDMALFITYIETVNFDVTGTVRLDVSQVHNGAAAMTVDVDGTGDVTLDASEKADSNTTYNGAGLTGSLTFIGGSGGSTVVGSAGDDTLNGSYAADGLTGGAGNDTFVFDDQLGGGVDGITDFTVSDTIALSLTIFGDVGALGTLGGSAFDSGAGMTAAAGAGVRIFHDTASGFLYYDADGSGTVEAPVSFAWLVDFPVLTNADFTIIS